MRRPGNASLVEHRKESALLFGLDDRCSIEGNPRRDDRTICTAGVPELFFAPSALRTDVIATRRSLMKP